MNKTQQFNLNKYKMIQSETTIESRIQSGIPREVSEIIEQANPASRTMPKVLDACDNQQPKYITIAPGLLNILGESCFCTGGLSIMKPVAEHACVAAQPMNDKPGSHHRLR